MPTYTDFIDTSDEYDTAFDKFGREPLGVPGVALTEHQTFGLGEARDIASVFNKAERRDIQEELDADPGFARILRFALAQRNPRAVLNLSAQKAIANEMDASMYPEAKGTWKVLRKKVLAAVHVVPKIIKEQLDSLTFPQRVKLLEAYVAGKRLDVGVVGMGFLGAADGTGTYDFLGAIANAAAGMYVGRLNAATAKDISKIQASAAIKQADVAATVAKAKETIALSQVKQEEYKTMQAKVSGVITQEIAGIPMWGWVLGLGALGVGLYFVLR